MRKGISVAVTLGSFVSALYACTGDDPTTLQPVVVLGNDGSTNTTDSSSQVSSPADTGTSITADSSRNEADTGGEEPVDAGDAGDASSDADIPDAAEEPISCELPEILCGTTCRDPRTTSQHCGRCNHSCGGAECALGKCKATTLITDVQELGGFSVSGGYFYFSANVSDGATIGRIARCLVSGCAPEEPVFYSSTLAAHVDQVLASGGLVAFPFWKSGGTEAQVKMCPVTGCPTSTPSHLSGNYYVPFAAAGTTFFIAGGEFSQKVQLRDCADYVSSQTCTTHDFGAGAIAGAAADATHLVYSRNGNELVYCDVPSRCAATPAVIGTTVPPWTAIYNNVLYAIDRGTSGQSTGHVMKCDLPGCAGGLTNFMNGLTYPSELVVDATGAYWISVDNDAIKTCPLTGCPGSGAITVVTGLGPSPKNLRTDAGFVYWTTEPTAARFTIQRVAKP